MKKDLLTVFLALAIFTFINTIGALINDAGNNTGGLDEVLEISFVHIIFLAFYLLTCNTNWKLRRSFRLPLIQLLIWVALFTSELIFKGKISLASADFLFLIVPGFCLPLNTILINNYIPFDETIFLLAFIFLYKILVLEIAEKLSAISFKSTTAKAV